MKRVLSFMTAFAMMIAMTALPAAAEKVQNAAGDWEIVNENFDDSAAIPTDIFEMGTAKTGMSYAAVSAAAENLPEAAAHGNVVKIAKTETDTTANTDSYFRIFYSGNNTIVASQCSKEELKHIRVSFDLYLPEKMQMIARGLDNYGRSTVGDDFLSFETDGKITLVDGSKIDYEVGKWQHFDIYLNFENTKEYSVYRNGTLVADKIPTKNLDTCIVSLTITTKVKTTAFTYYYDNLEFVVPGDFQMLSSVPENGAKNVTLTEPVEMTFNHPMPNMETSNITISANGTPVEDVTVSEKNGVVTVTPPAGGFAYETTYTVSADTGLTDIWGKSLAEAASISFTTEQEGAAKPDRNLVDENFDNDMAISTDIFDMGTAKIGMSYTAVNAADENLPEAAAHGNVAKIAKTATETTANTDGYFRIQYGGDKKVVASQCTVEELKHVKVSFDIYLPERMALRVRAYDNTSGSTKGDDLILFGSDGQVSFLNSTATMNYEVKTWYHFDIYLNFENTKEYTVYCNGESIVEQASTSNLDTCIVSFGMTMIGRTTAYTYYLDNMKFTVPGDFTLLSSVPANGAESIGIMEPVEMIFNHPAPNLSASGITVSANGTPVENVTISEKQNGVLAITPPADGFAYSTTYTVTATTGLSDIWGKSLAEEQSFSFTTEAAPPTFELTATSPANGATGVAVTEAVTLTFSNNLKDFDTTQVTVKAGETAVEGVIVSETNGVITITPPEGGFAYGTTYTINVAAGLKDIYGQSLAAVTILFTTEAVPVFELTAASPADGAADVDVLEPISFAFSNNLKNFDTTQVTVKAGETVVEGVMVREQDGVITVAPPEGGFAYETTYTVSIPTLTDIYGQTLAAMQRSFTTMKQPIPYNRALVDENFDGSTEIARDIFEMGDAKTGMSYTAVDAAAEDLPETAAHGNVVKIEKTATSSTANTDSYFRIQYGDKKVIASQASIEELKRVQTSFDVYFPEKMAMRVRALDNISGSSTKAENLIWFRANGTADFLDGSKMNYEAKTWYHFDIYLDFEATTPNYTVYCNGKRVANKVSAGVLDTCLVSFGVINDATVDTYTYYYDNVRFAIPAALQLVESLPAHDTENVDVTTQKMTLTFSSPLKNFDASKVTVKAGAATLENVTVTEQDGVITLTFPQKLDYETTYTVGIATGLEDIYGQILEETVNVSFKTVQRPAAFQLTESSPANGAENVDVGQEITLTFSNPIANFDASKVTVNAGATPVENVTVTAQDNVITITPPTIGFAFGTAHTVSVDASLADVHEQTLTAAAIISFTTANKPAAFELTESNPVNGAENVELTESVTLTFSNAVANFETSKVEIRANGTLVENAAVTMERNVITITPPAEGFAYETTYTVSVAADLTDVYGQTLAAPVTVSFTTVQSPAAFAMISSNPTNGAENVNIRNTVTLMFSNAIADFDASKVTVSMNGTAVANVTVSERNGVITIAPPVSGFAYGTTYTINIAAGLTDVYGQSLTEAITISFTTADEPQEERLDYNRVIVGETFDGVTSVPTTVFTLKAVDGLKTTVASAETEQLKEAADHGNVVKIAKDTTNIDYLFRIDYAENQVVATQCSIEELKLVQASFDIYLPEKMDVNVRFYDNISGTATKANNLITFGSDGKMSFSDGSFVEYEAGEWYKFHVYLDFNTMGYTVYCNEQLVAKNVLLKVLDSCIVSFGVVNGGTTEAYTYYLDNMRFAIPESLRLVESSPVNGAKNVNVLEPVTLALNNPFNGFDASKVTVRAGGELVRNVMVNEKDGIITLSFPEGLDYDTTYTVGVGMGLEDIYGQHLMTEHRISFTTMKKQFTVMQPVFQNSNGIQVTEWEDGMKAVATVKNPETVDKTAVLVTIVYDENGSMVKQFADEQTILAGQTKTLETVIDITYQEGYTVRSFLCEDAESLKQLSGIYAALPEMPQQPEETTDTVSIALEIPKLEQNKVELKGNISQKCVKTILLKVKAEDGTLILVTPVQTDAQGTFVYRFALPNGDKALYTVEAGGVDIGNRAEQTIGYLSDVQKAVITADINAAKSASDVEAVMQQWKPYLNLEDAAFESSVYQMVYEQMTYASYDAFRDTAALAVNLLQQINEAEWSELTKLLNAHSNILLKGVDSASRYAAYGAGDQNAISRTIVKSSPFSGISQFRDIFTRTVNAYQPGTGSGTSGGTGAPSGGGTSSGRPSNTSGGNYYATSDNNTGYVPNSTPVTGFTDLDTVPWAAESILTLCSMNIISVDNTYRPLDSITREEFVKLLVELLHLPLEEATCTFTDTESGAWYTRYLTAAQNAGIINGNPDGSFGIGTQISRQDMAVMAYRAVTAVGKTLQEKQQVESFRDADSISSYALEAVSKMQQAGVISGVGSNLFAPTDSANRAEAAVIIYRLLDTVGKEDVQ